MLIGFSEVDRPVFFSATSMLMTYFTSMLMNIIYVDANEHPLDSFVVDCPRFRRTYRIVSNPNELNGGENNECYADSKAEYKGHQ